MPGRNFSGLTPIENSGVNQHMPFAQKIFSDEKAFWNVDEWDLPAGAEMRENQNKDQATIYLPDDFPTPFRVQLRILTVTESDRHVSSVEGTQYSFSCAGRLFYRSSRFSDENQELYTGLFYRTVAWSAGLSPRFNQKRDQFNLVTGDAIEAILKTDVTEMHSAVVRNWWPISELEWSAKEGAQYWAPNDLVWSFPQLFELPRIAHSQLFPNNFKFEKTQALVSFPVVFENTAESLGKYHRKGKKTTQIPPPPPPPQESPPAEESNTWQDEYTSWDQQAQNEGGGGWWVEEVQEEEEPREWIQIQGHWYRKFG